MYAATAAEWSDPSRHVDPTVADAREFQILRNYGGGDQLAVRHYGVVPQLGVGRAVYGVDGYVMQFAEEPVYSLDLDVSAPQIVDDRGMILFYAFYLVGRLALSSVLHVGENALQRVGRLAHRRDDNKQILFTVDYASQVSHAVGALHRGSSEFVDLHNTLSEYSLFGCKGINFCIRRHGVSTILSIFTAQNENKYV